MKSQFQSSCSASTCSHNEHSLRESVVFRDVFRSSDLPHLVLIVCYKIHRSYGKVFSPNVFMKTRYTFQSNTEVTCLSTISVKLFEGWWGMLTGRINKFSHKSTLQQEVKLDTGEFDPLYQLIDTSSWIWQWWGMMVLEWESKTRGTEKCLKMGDECKDMRDNEAKSLHSL